MNSKEFFEKVRLMRRLQRQYARTKGLLAQCQSVERAIDGEIERVNRILGTSTVTVTQLSLLDGAEDRR